MKKSLLRVGMGMLLVAAFASCQKLGPMKAEYFTVNPNPLEVKAGKVEGTITANFPEKYFAEKAVVEVTPVLKYKGGEALGTPVSYQGTKVQGNDQTIQYKAGGTVTQGFSFDYVPEMAESVLSLRFKATLKDKEVQVPEVDIAIGCIATSTLADASSVSPAFAKDKFVRDTKEVTEASIMFAIQKSDVKCNDDVKALNKVAADAKNDAKRTVEGLTLVSAASPDGGYELNEKLAASREKNTQAFLKKQKNQAAIDAKYIAQDWDGFQKLVQESSVKDKDLILRVLGAYQDAEQREKEIKNLSAAYTELASDILPKLRRSHLALTINVAGKTDAELLEIAKSNSDSLTVEELLYAAKLACTSGNKEDAAKFTAANAAQNPSDWRTQNNQGAVNFAKGDLSATKSALNNSVNNGGANEPETNFNLGLVALEENQPNQAQQYFGKAAGVEQLGEGQGLMYIQQGEYAKAVSAFGNASTNNAALAQMLVNNNDKAISILNNVSEKDATTYYLLAVCSARTANDAQVCSNLSQAISLNPDYSARAKSDLEFGKYWTLDSFKNVVK